MNGKPIQFEKDRAKRMRSRLLAPLSAKHRNRVRSLVLSPQRRLAYGDTILTPDRKFLFVKNAKAACTTIAGVLYEYSAGSATSAFIHRENRILLQDLSYWRAYDDAIASEECIAFTFVRDPRRRFVSAFKDFFFDEANHARKNHMGNMAAWGFDRDRSAEWNLGVFADYVAASIERDPVYTDRHWREQWRNIALGEIEYDFTGKVENYDADMAKVFEMAGIPDAWSGSLREHRANEFSKSRVDLPDDIARRVELLYAKDFEAFGYT